MLTVSRAQVTIVAVTESNCSRSQQVRRCKTNSGAQASESAGDLPAYRGRQRSNVDLSRAIMGVMSDRFRKA